MLRENDTADPSASSGFPVRISGFGEPHAAFLKESRIRGFFASSVVGNAEFAPMSSPGQAKYGLNGAPKAFVADVISLFTRQRESPVPTARRDRRTGRCANPLFSAA
jgi:hypothetical protein